MSPRPDPVFYGPLEFLADQELRHAWDLHDRANELGDVPPGTGNVTQFPPQLRLVTTEATTTTTTKGQAS